MNNPLLAADPLPAFDQIRPGHVEPALRQALDGVRDRIRKLLKTGPPYSWESLAAPMEMELEHVHRVWSPVRHLNSVMNSPELRAAYNTCLPKITNFETEIGQDRKLFKAFRSIADSPEFAQLDQARRKSIENRLRDFRLAGIELEKKQRKQFKKIQRQLSRRSAAFQENLLDATNAWSRQITDRKLLTGLPGTALDLARQTAGHRELEGWLLTLEYPSYAPVINYADNRMLRREVYTAYVTRASDTGPHAGQWDNSQRMEEILQLRYKAARLLGFDNYAERSLATKMANSVAEVLEFLNGLAGHALDRARAELDEVREFAAAQGADYSLEAWDVPYWSEKLRHQLHAISREELKPWFPETRVLPGLFAVVNRLYGIEIRERTGVSTWHPDVRFFDIYDAQQQLRGSFYLDLYARPNKRGGAWMDDAASRMILGDHEQIPVAYLTCNFSPPIGDQPALLGHDEVTTLFHEFGHGLHHMLTRVDCPSVAGINGVAWDAVELPSQFMENWCWEREALNLISGHYQTGEPLPDGLFRRMQAARNFQSGMQMVRQLEFALFDLRLHAEFDPQQGSRIQQTLDRVRQQVAVIQPPDFNRFAHGFAHIFGGGYAAGYYSYKWAEVLSADAFSLFEEQGIFDAAAGARFLGEVLEKGGSEDAMELYVAFRGRKADIAPLLRHSGLG